ncbi:MAG: polysaccharide pyruvyl transferase family protein, partial [bacterium]|nr:polysaccharide pyruvyl transferase family protein [bacterium]
MNRVSIPSYLKSLAAKPLYYMPNGGNAGDALIAQATYQMLGDHQIEYEIVSPRDDLTDQVVAYGGGGNFT